jgi:hypothetical protein
MRISSSATKLQCTVCNCSLHAHALLLGLLVFEELLSVLETGLVGNAVCKADEVVEVDRAFAEESLFLRKHLYLQVAHVGAVQDCALLCKNNDLFQFTFETEGHHCIGFKFDTGLQSDAGGGGCSLLFQDSGAPELSDLSPQSDTEKVLQHCRLSMKTPNPLR